MENGGAATGMTAMAAAKSVHCMVLDASPLLVNEPSISSLLLAADTLYTVPAVLAEIRDPVARNRVETTVQPFLSVRQPAPASLAVVTAFARKTGDAAVLSGADLQVLALAYELDCELTGGERLRTTPASQQKNGPEPASIAEPHCPSESAAGVEQHEDQEVTASERQQGESEAITATEQKSENEPVTATEEHSESKPIVAAGQHEASTPTTIEQRSGSRTGTDEGQQGNSESAPVDAAEPSKPHAADSTFESTGGEIAMTHDSTVSADTATKPTPEEIADGIAALAVQDDESASDGEGWITPSNLKRHQRKDQDALAKPDQAAPRMEVATLTTDYALQNTLLLMNLNLVSTSLRRISHLKSHVLRCHACFATSKQMDRQFCARCGKPTLTRVTCTTSASGEFRLHLKRNMQWNHRGDRFSIPKPTEGSASGRVGKGGRGQGGKGGWGAQLMFSEDQKEYTRAVASQKRQRQRDLMDEDYLPNLLSGARSSTSRVQIGPGRSVNARKR